ncbi:UNKNOWN [Stylonychia lemnae]|uniref:Uncharacterized protein n=1 Tax=Stylonychia lemnae TaxID=5949 RepID=A0A078AHB9_STYLE|nr:UNKNOWN [Stylonychia lemnae]|eukprot:CDW81685.1 UNKNOWN [Stylonychia lemnae]
MDNNSKNIYIFTVLFNLNIVLGSAIAAPSCFSKNQLPIEIQDGQNTNQSFTSIAYHSINNYFAVGGVYGKDQMIGLYNEAIEFQQSSSIISLIRTQPYDQISGLDQTDFILLKNDLAGTIKYSSSIPNAGVFKRLMPNIMSDLFEIKQQHSLKNSVSTYFYSLYFVPQIDDVYLWGKAIPAHALVDYDVIIPLIEYADEFNYLVGCLEAQNTTEAFFGVIIHQTSTLENRILYRNVKEHQNQAGFICLGIAVFTSDSIVVFFRPRILNNDDGLHFLQIYNDPFAKSLLLLLQTNKQILALQQQQKIQCHISIYGNIKIQ